MFHTTRTHAHSVGSVNDDQFRMHGIQISSSVSIFKFWLTRIINFGFKKDVNFGKKKQKKFEIKIVFANILSVSKP